MGGAYVGDVFPNALFENPGHSQRWLRLTLEGVASKRPAISVRVAVGAREAVRGGAAGAAAGAHGAEAGGAATCTRTIHRVVGTGGSLGSNSLALELGLGAATAIGQVRIAWPGSSTVQVLRDVEVGGVCHTFEVRGG